MAVIGDVHANLPALRAVLEDASRIGADAMYCVGDVVGRGPHPNEVVAELQAHGIPTVQGNWDEAAAMDRAQSGAPWGSEASEAEGNRSLAWTQARLTDDSRAWLRALEFSLRLKEEGRSILLFHGSHVKQNECLWEDRPTRTFARVTADEGDDLFCFGHTHQYFHRQVAGAHFVAVGSVGCGTAQDARARYAVLWITPSEMVAGFRAVDYDRSGLLSDMEAAGLSPDLLRVPPAQAPLPGELPSTLGEALSPSEGG